MIDIGTIPLKDSIAKLTYYMNDKNHSHVGGVAGEIETFNPDPEKDSNPWDKFESYSLFLA